MEKKEKEGNHLEARGLMVTSGEDAKEEVAESTVSVKSFPSQFPVSNNLVSLICLGFVGRDSAACKTNR